MSTVAGKQVITAMMASMLGVASHFRRIIRFDGPPPAAANPTPKTCTIRSGYAPPRKNGEREMARRRNQIAKGMIAVTG